MARMRKTAARKKTEPKSTITVVRTTKTIITTPGTDSYRQRDIWTLEAIGDNQIQITAPCGSDRIITVAAAALLGSTLATLAVELQGDTNG